MGKLKPNNRIADEKVGIERRHGLSAVVQKDPLAHGAATFSCTKKALIKEVEAIINSKDGAVRKGQIFSTVMKIYSDGCEELAFKLIASKKIHDEGELDMLVRCIKTEENVIKLERALSEPFYAKYRKFLNENRLGA